MPQTVHYPGTAATASAAVVASGALHRAIVTLPAQLLEPDTQIEERVVFYEVPAGADRGGCLEQLLARAWCVDTVGWVRRGVIYNIDSAAELVQRAAGAEGTGDLRLFETGAGGDPRRAVGSQRLHYARADIVDLFVSPRVASRLRRLLDAIDDLYAAAAGRSAGGQGGHGA